MSSDSTRPLFERSDDDRLIAVGSATELPRHGFEPPTIAPRRARLRQAALLVLMALAGGLIFVLPEPTEDGYALSSDQESTIRIGPGDAATGVQRLGGSEGADEGDELALASGGGQRGVIGGVDGSSVDSEQATENPDDTGDHNLAAGIADMAALAMIPSAPEVTETTQAPTTTTAPQDTAAETTAITEAATTTSAPTTTVASDESADAAGDTRSAGEDGTAPAADGDSASAEGGADTSPETSSPDTGDNNGSDEQTTTTSEPEPPADTQPPETTPEPEPADPGWVDTGNGVLVPPVLVAIRYCESRGDYVAANPNSSARGAYQFLTGSWDYYGHKARYGVNQAHLATPAQQDEAALMTWEREGTRPWNASKSCWEQRI